MSRRSSLERHRWEINVDIPALKGLAGRHWWALAWKGGCRWLKVQRGGRLIWWMTRSSGSNSLQSLQHNTRAHPTFPATAMLYSNDAAQRKAAESQQIVILSLWFMLWLLMGSRSNSHTFLDPDFDCNVQSRQIWWCRFIYVTCL